MCNVYLGTLKHIASHAPVTVVLIDFGMLGAHCIIIGNKSAASMTMYLGTITTSPFCTHGLHSPATHSFFVYTTPSAVSRASTRANNSWIARMLIAWNASYLSW